jgi:hypothetical protein
MKATPEVREFLAKAGQAGGKARAQKLSKKRRVEIATAASKAAAELRTKRALFRKEGYV